MNLKEVKEQEVQPIFKKGDVVRLKSGGPFMTVNAEFRGAFNIDSFTGTFMCIYHIQGETTAQIKPFIQDTLELAPEDEVNAFKKQANWKQLNF